MMYIDPNSDEFKKESDKMLSGLRDYTRSFGLDFDENGVTVLNSVPVTIQNKKSRWQKFTEIFLHQKR